MTDIWLGSEVSYLEANAALGKIEAHKVQLGARACAEAEAEDENKPHLLSVIDGVGIISIHGPLVEGNVGFWGKLFGVTGYGDIAQAAIAAVKDPTVTSILLDIKSPGGNVNGVAETSNFLADIDKIKPVMAFSSSMMASAALWLGVSARKVMVSDSSIVGSVGAMSVLVSRHRQLKDEGVDAEVIRSGDHKALGHPVDPFSEVAKASKQEQVDYFAAMFVTHIAEKRGMSASAAKAKFGDGREFIGTQALGSGLVDEVTTYSEAFTKTQNSAPKSDNRMKVLGGNVAATSVHGDNPLEAKGQDMKITHLPSTEQLLAMVTASVPTDLKVVPPVDTTAAVVTDSVVTGVEDTAVDLTATVAELEGKLTAANASVTEMSDKVTALTKQVEDLTIKASAADTLAEIVLGNVKGMKIALGGKAEDVTATTATEVVAAHTDLSTLFKEKFKVGGVAATNTEKEKPAPVKAQINPLFLAAASLKQSRK